MKAKNLLISLLAIVFTAGIGQAEDKPAEELSNTRQAAVTLRITTDPKLFPMGTEEHSIGRLLNQNAAEQLSTVDWDKLHSGIIDTVGQEVIGVDHWNDRIESLIVEHPKEVAGLQTARIRLIVSIPEQYKPAAKEFLEAYIEKLKSALHKEADLARKLHRKKFDVYMQRRHNAEMNLHNLLNTQSGLFGGQGKLDKESVRERILEHEKTMIENEMQRAMLRKRAEEISRQIQIIRAKTEALSQDDEIVQISKDVVMNLEEQLEKQQQSYKSGLISSEEISSVKDRLLRSKLELSKRLEQLQSQSAEDAHELNRQLRETTMQLEELEIKETILAGYSPGNISSSIEYEMLEVKIEAAKENLRRAIIGSDEAALEYEL
ncbi:MAG: hypothetical protein ACYSOK_04810, partial [Planctomycetota bacterium]